MIKSINLLGGPGKWHWVFAGLLLTAGDESFGFVVDIAGSTAVVGAPGSAAYVFRKKSGGWTEKARLEEAGGDPFSSFGRAVATDGHRVFVGAPGGSAVYVYQL